MLGDGVDLRCMVIGFLSNTLVMGPLFLFISIRLGIEVCSQFILYG